MIDKPKPAYRARLTAAFLISSGVLFTLFPVVRPFFAESTFQGAAGFASPRWVVAHSLGMGGFILLSLGFLGLYARLRQTEVERRTFLAVVLMWVGAGLTLPFFGAEAFGLQVIGREALNQDNAALLVLVNAVRLGPGLVFVGVGLALVAAAAIILATAIGKSGVLPRGSGIPLAVGLAVYIPQLQGAPLFQPIRIAVGLLILAGCIWVAAGLLRGGRAIEAA